MIGLKSGVVGGRRDVSADASLSGVWDGVVPFAHEKLDGRRETWTNY